MSVRSKAQIIVFACVVISLSPLVASCGKSTRGTRVDISRPGFIDSFAEQDGVIYFLNSSDSASDDTEASTLWRTSGGVPTKKIGMTPMEGACKHPTLFSLRSAAPGTLGAMAQCVAEGKYYYVHIDIRATKPTATIVATTPSALYDVAWNERSDSGWAAYPAYGDDSCAAIGQLTPNGVTRFGEVLPHDTFSWALDYDLMGWPYDSSTSPAAACMNDGEASFPAMGSQADTLYFLASASAIGKAPSTFDRVHAPWSAYVMNTTSHSVTPLGSGFTDVIDVDATTEGDRFAIVGTYSGISGIWLVGTGHPGVKLLVEGRFGAVRFASGNRILGFQLVSVKSNGELWSYSLPKE